MWETYFLASALTLTALNRYSEAEQDILTAVGLDKRSVPAVVAQLFLYISRHDYAGAIVAADTLSHLQHRAAHHHVNRSFVYWLQRRYEDGIDACNMALALDPNCAVALFNRAALRVARCHDDASPPMTEEERFHEYDLSLADYTRTIMLNRNDLALWNRSLLLIRYFEQTGHLWFFSYCFRLGVTSPTRHLEIPHWK